MESAAEGTEDVRERIAALPPELGAVLRPVLPSVADEILVAIRADVPEYRRPFGGAFGRVVRRGVEFSLGEFVAFVEDPARESQNDRMIEELGRGEVRAGRTLDALQSAYRTGARVAWRRFADAARADGADAAVLVPLGEAIFAYIHRLAGLSVTGWAHEQSLRAGATQRARDRLVRLVVSGRDLADLDAAALELGWTPPARVAVVVVPGAEGPGDLLRIDPSIVAAVVDGAAVGLVPAPAVLARVVAALGSGVAGRGGAAGDGTAAGGAATAGPGGAAGDGTGVGGARAAAADGAGRADAAVGGAGTDGSGRDGASSAVIGPAVPWEDVGRSHRRAGSLVALVAAGRLGVGSGAVLADHHLTDLVVHGDGEAADDLADAVLGPLDALPGGRRERHLETLGAWLDHRGHGPRMAEALHLHPQTVRYRMARLRETLDVDPEDPDARFALELALRRRGTRGG